MNDKEYNKLLNSIDCTIISYKEALESSYCKRLESEYFSKDSLYIKDISENWPTLISLCEKKGIRSGKTPADRNDELKEGVILLKTDKIRNQPLVLGSDDYYYIDAETNDKMKSSKLKPNDILINIVGASTKVVGRTSFVYKTFPIANITQAMSLIRIENDNYLPEYVYIFLSGKYGNMQTKRMARQTEQFNINNIELGSYRIPCLSKEIQLKVKDLVTKSSECQIESKNKYKEAEDLILNHLKYYSASINNNNISIRKYSESYKNTGRLDSEYYQIKYDDYLKLINKNILGITKISDKFDQVKSKCKKNKGSYNYIEIGDINTIDGSYNYNEIPTDELPSNAKIMANKNNLLVSTVRPNRGAVSILRDDDVLVSGAFVVLKEKSDYPKEVLQVLLRTKLYRDWLLKYNVGTSYPVIREHDVMNMIIPIFSEKINIEVIKKITEATEQRNNANDYISQAISIVESEIEKEILNENDKN